MTPAANVKAHFAGMMDDLRSRYLIVVHASTKHEHVPEHLWRSFQTQLQTVLMWSDIAAASATRRRATGTQLNMPSGKLTLPAIHMDNPWLVHHGNKTADNIARHVKLVMKSEREYVERLRKRKDVYEVEPLHRMEMFYRNAVGDVTAHAQQVQLNVPDIGNQFPFLLYRSKDDKRVRPTHFMMNGFVALRNHDIWKIIRPKNGYNCRCWLDLVSFRQALDRGWVSSSGQPKFELRWPSSGAEFSFTSGWFPDPGWRGPKYVAA